MSAVEPSAHIIPASAPIVRERAVVRDFKPAIGLGAFAVLGLLLFGLGARTGSTTFRLSTDSDRIQLAAVVLDVRVVTTVVTV